MRRIIVAVEADWHSNNRYGLLNPDTYLYSDDGGMYSPSSVPVQEFLWELRTQNLEKLRALADGDPIFFFHLGDPTQGFKHKTELVSNAPVNETRIAMSNARPVLQIPNVEVARFVIGTEAHEGVGGSSVRQLYDRLSVEFPMVDIDCIYHGFADIDGQTVDYTHHGPTTGIRKWTEGNQLRYYCKDIMIDDLLNGREPPRYLFRGHVHRKAWETVRIELDHDQFVTSDIMVVPSMCDMGAFARQITRSENKITNGMTCLEIYDGELLKVHWLTVTRDLRKREIL